MKTTNTFQRNIMGLRQKQHLLGILVFSLVTIVLWMIGSLVSSQKTTTIPRELLRLAKPLTPFLDEETISRIEQKRRFSDPELRSFTIYTIIGTLRGEDERLVPLGSSLLLPAPSPSPATAPNSTSSGEITTSVTPSEPSSGETTGSSPSGTTTTQGTP